MAPKLAHEASDHDALDQEASEAAVLAQLGVEDLEPGRGSVVTNRLSAAFGFGELVPTSPSASRTPTPSAGKGLLPAWKVGVEP